MRTPQTEADTLDDAALYREFEERRIPKEAFRHAEHVRLAFIYLRRYSDFAEAAMRFRRALRSFVETKGVAHIFNETLTWAYLVLINERMHAASARDSLEFLRHNADLCRHRNGLIAEYYDLEETSRSALAKEIFVLPARRSPTGTEPSRS